jgi:hypothetical protein
VLAEWIETRELANAEPATKASQPSASSASKDTPAATSAAKPSLSAIDKRAISLYDQLRLRTAFGESFAFIGVEGEDAWRAAARIRVALLPGAPENRSVKQDETQGWWSDADVRWLTGLHEAVSGWYFNKESHQQMVWWATLPELVKVQTDSIVEKQRLNKLAKAIDAELLEAERVHYCLRKPVSKATPMKPEVASNAASTPISPGVPLEEANAGQNPTSVEVATAEGQVVALAGANTPSPKE